MVDAIQKWPNARPPFHRGSAHLTTDSDDLAELHAFARKLGLRRAWFQDHPIAPHYDLTPRRHAVALALGAKLVSSREQTAFTTKEPDDHFDSFEYARSLEALQKLHDAVMGPVTRPRPGAGRGGPG